MPKTRMNTRKTEKPLRFLGFLFWSEWGDLNPRPLGPEPSALPAALHPGYLFHYNEYFPFCQEGKRNITVKSSSFTARCPARG